MSDADFRQPDPGLMRAAAEVAELPHAVFGPATAYGYRLVGSDPLASLARRVMARSMTGAGLSVDHCAPHDPPYQLREICLLLVPARPDAGGCVIAVPWIGHNLLDWYEYRTHTGTKQAMNTVIGGILRALGYAVQLYGYRREQLVTGHRHRDQGAG
jgi:hypothetical protein